MLDSSPALQILLNSGFLSDSKTLVTSHSGCDGTYHGFDLSKQPSVILDHIFVTKDIGVGPYHVVDEELQTGKFGSDHLPVITDIKLP
jgi:endonuclease/exonuclease/phosphatase family metal-dependent hydrolase